MVEKNLPQKVLDLIEMDTLLLEDHGFSYSAPNCSGCGGQSCFSCGGGCYGCHTPNEESSDSKTEYNKTPELLK